MTRNLVERIRLKMVPEEKPVEEDQKILKAELILRIERNNKFVRGMKRSREDIERFVLPYYQMQKKEGRYILQIPYENEDDLEKTCYEILNECESQANMHHCWTEGFVAALDGSDRSWG